MKWLRMSGAAAVVALVGMLWLHAAVAQTIRPAPAFKKKDLAALPHSGWLTNGGNLANQRFSPLDQINRDNVRDLKAVWRAALDSGLKQNNQAQPIVHDGVVYITTGEDDVFAISVETGAILWRYEAGLDPKEVVVCCGWVNRGVAIGAGKVFVGRLDAKLVALDQKTGRELWSVQPANPRIGYSLTAAPLYYDGMVIIGFAGGDMGTRGRIQAFDAKHGKLRWTFYTIPAPGEPGHETWPRQNTIWQYGGAPVWHTPAVDPELGLIYFGTGNPGPDLGAMVREGDNLYSDSIVALDARTGKYRWHFQQVHHDIWDYDAPNPVVLFDAEFAGEPRKALAQAGKTGWVYVLDRETGEPLLPIEERPVPIEPRQATALTQPFPVGDAVVPQSIDMDLEDYDLVNEGRIFTPYFEQGVIYKPMAAVNWPPSSFDPRTNRLFICANDQTSGARADDSQYGEPNFRQQFLGGALLSGGTSRRGVFAAMDVTTNRLVWRRQWSDGCRSGSLATAGGLVFVGRNDGRLAALDSDTGLRLWEFRTDAPINTAVSAFEYRGEQYLVTYAGGSLYTGQGGDGVWLFSLRGNLQPVPPPPSRFTPALTATVPEGRRADLYHGRVLYEQSCQYCHGSTGAGGHGGGKALGAALTTAEIMAILTGGRNAMPAFSTVLTGEDMHDVAGYIVEQLVRP
ncbi:MAG: PQQ-binding-like beta-propeller repeat protein [Gammaproteobacteria bacterium]|nr:PQQ-binding-like beta-propeller repeat protein [Gammaproteobacteria bacterium]